MLCFLLGNRLTPSAVDVADIMKTSAIVSWTAASSYIEHVVSVEGHCETVTRPGVHRCLITGKQLSISLGSKPVGVDCNLFQSSYSLYSGVICTPPPTLSLCPGLGPIQILFLIPVVSFWGVQEAEISIHISARAGV